MSKKTGRREFVGTAASLVAGAWATQSCSKSSSAEQTASAGPASKSALGADATMVTSVEVEFGGLCMLVKNESKDHPERTGLFALMPETKSQWTGAKMVHCPAVIVPGEHLGPGQKTMVAPLTDFVDLRWLNARPWDSTMTLPGSLLKISKYARQPVEARWLTDSAPADCLAGRIRLPLGVTTINPFPDTGQIQAPVGTGPATPFVGRVTCVIPVDAKHVSGLAIGPFNLIPDSKGVIRVTFVNVRLSDLRDPVPLPVTQGVTELKHAQAYYWLLAGHCAGHTGGPPILAGETVSAPDRPDNDTDCLTAPEELAHFITVKGKRYPYWIYPLECTVGDGCGPDETGCT